MSLRPEVRALVAERELLTRRADHRQALAFIAQAEQRLEAASLLRREGHALSAFDAYYSATWDALRALMEEFGLQLGNTKGEDGQHAITMKFGESELRDTAEEREAGGHLRGIKEQRNANHYRLASATLGIVPKVSVVVVGAARHRIGTD